MEHRPPKDVSTQTVRITVLSQRIEEKLLRPEVISRIPDIAALKNSLSINGVIIPHIMVKIII